MKRLLVTLALLGFSSSFAFTTSDVNVAKGKEDKCFARAFFATRPSDDQKAKAHDIHETVKKVYEDNMSAIKDALAAYEAVMMKHPINADDAVKAAHGLGDAVHPVQAARFMGAIDIVNLLSDKQREVFNRVMKRCSKFQ